MNQTKCKDSVRPKVDAWPLKVGLYSSKCRTPQGYNNEKDTVQFPKNSWY